METLQTTLLALGAEAWLLGLALGTAGLGLGALVTWLAARAHHGRLEERLEREREAALEKMALLDDAQKRLSDSFQ
ncbi:MAG: hypothetical protein HKP30_12190, partial [Myxococcales bacterium]|nr:hypothetical protein [Myxococcales bacterium]